MAHRDYASPGWRPPQLAAGRSAGVTSVFPSGSTIRASCPYPERMASTTPQVERRTLGGSLLRLALFLGVSALAGVLVAGLVLPVAGGLGFAARATTDEFQQLPSDLSSPPLAQRSRILDAAGRPIATFYYENRVLVPISKISPVMRKALIAIEDSRFYQHNGLDLRGTLRALMRNTAEGGVTQGGSTLTQQLVKLTLVEAADGDAEKIAAAQEDSLARKLQELRYAIAMEERLSKDQILEKYLNIAYFGAGAYGVEAAARRLFGVSADELSLRQAATLAGLVRAPSAYDPTVNPEAARQRRNVVLARMAELGFAREKKAERAADRGLGLNIVEAPNGCADAGSPAFFCDYVTRVLRNDPAFGRTPTERSRVLFRGGLTIRTTLRPRVQRGAQQAVYAYTNRTDRVGTAIAMVEPSTGEIHAMAQNHRWGEKGRQTQVNYATDFVHGGSRGFQAGSTFKAFTAAAALEKGIGPRHGIFSPYQLTFEDQQELSPQQSCGGDPLLWNDPEHEPVNFVRSENGRYDMREALAKSVNTYFLQLQAELGGCPVFRMAKRLGIRLAEGGDLRQVLTFTLGVNEVTPLAMASAYATFANRGVRCEPVAITEVTDSEGNQLSVPEPQCERVLDQNVADTMNDVLGSVIAPGGTGGGLELGRDAAGKTGTTDGARSVMFIGYTPDMSAAVWTGYPGVSKPLKNVTIGDQFYASLCGGCLPGPVWKQAMTTALKSVEPSSFVAPDLSQYKAEDGAVPDLRGLTVAAARAELRTAGFSAAVAPGRVSSVIPAGQVVSTTPSNGTSAAPGTTVTLVVSRGL